MWKFGVEILRKGTNFAEFWANRLKLYRNCAFPQNCPTRKLGKNSVFTQWWHWDFTVKILKCYEVLCVSRYCVVTFVSLCEFEYWIKFEYWLKLFVWYISSTWDGGGGITISVAGLIYTSTLGTSFSCVIWLVVAVTTRCITTVHPEPKSN